MKNELAISERAFEQGTILDLKGDLTKQSEETLLKWRDWERELEGKRALVLNLSEVGTINSAGIATLIRLAQHGQRAGFHIFGYGISPHYQKMFRLIGLTEFILLYPDEYALMLRFRQGL